MTNFFSLTDLGLAGSSGQLLQDWLAQMQSFFPGYSPSVGNLEYIQAEVLATQAADLAQLASSGGTELFRTFGTTLLGLPYQTGTGAQAVVSVQAVDTVGYTLPAGTQLTLDLGGAPLGFQTVADLVIPPGSSSGQTAVIAVTPGQAFNGAGPPAALLSQITWVTGVTVVSNAADGVDPEDDQHYLDRLVTVLQLLAPRPITANDYATLALDFPPTTGTDQQQVGRATAIDGYDPVTNTFNNQREVAVCIADGNGNPLNADTVTAVQAWFQTQREVNFIVNVVSPNYSTIYVALQAHAAPGWTPATVQTNIQTALLAYLTPLQWGLPFRTNVGWTNTTTIFRSTIQQAIQNAGGVDHIVTGTLAVDLTNPPGNTTNDLVLPGPFPMPVSTASSIPLSSIVMV